MLISFIVPLYRGNKYVKGIVDNIVDNSRNLNKNSDVEASAEIIFINDCPEEKVDIVKNPLVVSTLIEHKINGGIHRSRADGLERSSGDFVVFFDQDDLLSEDYLITQLDSLYREDADWVISNGIYRTNRIIYSDEQAVLDLLDNKHYFTDLTEIISPGQVLMKRSIIPDIWKENILKRNYCDDAFLWLLLKNSGIKSAFNDNIVYFHNEDGYNTSFSWKRNANALRELKDTVLSTNCLSEENLDIFIPTIDNEIIKQDSYARLEELYSLIVERNDRDLFMQVIKSQSVVIYGYGIWGRKLYNLFEDSKIHVEAVIDRNIKGEVEGVSVCHPDEVLNYISDVSNCLMIITPLAQVEVVISDMNKKGISVFLSIMELFEAILSVSEDVD